MSTAMPVLEAQGPATERASRHRVDVWEVALGPRTAFRGSPMEWVRSSRSGPLGRHDGRAAAGPRPPWGEVGPTAIVVAATLLSDSERGFAARLRVGSGAWVAARAALRLVLGRYLGVGPRHVLLEAGANGKPRLAPGVSPDLRFNLAHSGGLALIAVRLGLEVGIDAEERRSGVDGVAIARHVFGETEGTAAAALAAESSEQRFFRSWTRREALAKATGRGIASLPAPVDDARFTVRDLDGIPGFAAALASEGANWTVRRIGPVPVDIIAVGRLDHSR